MHSGLIMLNSDNASSRTVSPFVCHNGLQQMLAMITRRFYLQLHIFDKIFLIAKFITDTLTALIPDVLLSLIFRPWL